MSTEIKYSNEIKNATYYCPCCGHPNLFLKTQNKKLCSYCGRYYNKPKYSVEEESLIERIKRTYKRFLMKKEGMKNGI